MQAKNAELIIPIGLFLAIVSAAVGYGTATARIDALDVRITKIETITEKMHSLELKLDKLSTLLEQHMKGHR